jgi:DNA-binding NarL/FixJ family response regulator
MIRVLIVDDHALVRSGLAQLLSAAGIEVVGEAADGGEAIEAVERLSPDVVLMDLSMPGLNGTEATRLLRLSHPELPVVVLTSFSDREQVLDALDAGAVGYILKDDDPADVIRGVKAAVRGESVITPKAARVVLSARAAKGRDDGLTQREKQVLALVAQGLANKLIARRLGISEKTVKAHLTKLFASIGVTDRTQAALWAKRHNMV